MELHELSYNGLTCSSLSLHALHWACMQFPKLTWSSMSLQVVWWACRQFHKPVCSSFLCLSSSQEFRSACYRMIAFLLSKQPTNVCRIENIIICYKINFRYPLDEGLTNCISLLPLTWNMIHIWSRTFPGRGQWSGNQVSRPGRGHSWSDDEWKTHITS